MSKTALSGAYYIGGLNAIDPTECRGQLSQDVFEDVYAQYLLWHMSLPQEHSLRALCVADDGWETTDLQ